MGKTKFRDLFALPQIKTQCVHVSLEELSEGIEVVRCVNDSDPSGRHGFLCTEHYSEQQVTRVRREDRRDRENETVASILAYEERALRVGRDVVDIGPSIRIQYVRKT